MARRNPSRTVADPVAARELFLYITNDGDLYERNISLVLKNLQKKIAKGNYDPKKALKLWGYSAEWGAQKYARDFGGTWHSMFNASTRREVAKQLADYYEEALRETNPGNGSSKRYDLHRLKDMRRVASKIKEGDVLYFGGSSASWGERSLAESNAKKLEPLLRKKGLKLEDAQFTPYVFVERSSKRNPRRKRTRRNGGSRFTSKDLREEIKDLNDYYGLNSKTGKFVLGQAYGGNQIQWQIAGTTAIRSITSGFDTPRKAWDAFRDPDYWVDRYKNEKRNPQRSRSGRYSYDPSASTIIMVPPSMRTTRKMKRTTKKTKKVKRNAGCAPKDNPPVPKGKRKGDVYTRKGKKYRVVSYINSNGTRVRYSRKIKNIKRKKR